MLPAVQLLAMHLGPQLVVSEDKNGILFTPGFGTLPLSSELDI